MQEYMITHAVYFPDIMHEFLLKWLGSGPVSSHVTISHLRLILIIADHSSIYSLVITVGLSQI